MGELTGGGNCDRRLGGHRRRDRQRAVAAGAAVVVNYAYSKEDADRVVADITGEGGKAIAVKADVSK